MGCRIALLLIASLWFTGCSRQSPAAPAQAQIKWEYRTLRFENTAREQTLGVLKDATLNNQDKADALLTIKSMPLPATIDTEKLNALGAEGWEVCGSFVEPETIQPVGDMKAANTRAGAAVLVLKRAVVK